MQHVNHLRRDQKCLETGKTTKSLEYRKCLETGETTKSFITHTGRSYSTILINDHHPHHDEQGLTLVKLKCVSSTLPPFHLLSFLLT